MFDTLRVRFALTHTLPILLLMPLLSLVLLYLLQTQYFLNNLADELSAEAAIIASLTRDDRPLWQEPAVARAFVHGLPEQMSMRVMLIDHNGRLLAGSSPEGRLTGEPVEVPVVNDALQGDSAWEIRFSVALRERVVEVAVPVFNDNGELTGVVYLAQGVTAIQSRLTLISWVVVIAFTIGLVAALMLALFLARSLGMPLVRLTEAVGRARFDAPASPVPVVGPREIRELATKFNESMEQLRAVTVTRRRLLAGIVHEMSRPLGGISAAAQFMSKNKAPDPAVVTELATEMVEQVAQMQRQIDDLALLARSGEGEIELHVRPTDLHALCEEECRRIRPKVDQMGIQLICELAEDTPTLTADPGRVEQIVANLLSNAVKFTPAGGQINVRLAPHYQNDTLAGAMLSVTDTGPGIDPAEQEHIFEFFYRSPMQGPLREGMGIGLAVARQLALAHGGFLDVYSRPGAGATFILRLPLAAPTLASTAQPDTP